VEQQSHSCQWLVSAPTSRGQHYLNTVKGRPYHRHAPGHGGAYRLRGSLLGAGNEGGSLTKAGKQSGTALISTAAVIALPLREGGESAVSTTVTGGLDSSFAASTLAASMRRSGDREGHGGGQEEEGASNHTEEEGGSYAEEEGTIEGIGSSIRGSEGESFLSEQLRWPGGSWGCFSSCYIGVGIPQDAAAHIRSGHKG
jgi:hypothetical protein